MNSALHPWVHEAGIAIPRAGWRPFARALGMPVLLLLVCVALASAGLRLDSPRWLLAGVAVAVSGSYVVTRGALVRMLVNWHSGWYGALPIEPRVARRTLLLMVGGALAVAMVCASGLLSLAAIGASHRARFPVALVLLDAGLVVGATIALIVAFRWARGARGRRAGVIREPLLALGWLNDPRLPHLLDWQRRDALVRWRSGGSFIWIGVLLVLLPHGVIFRIAMGMVLLALSLVWWTVIVPACACVTIEAMTVLRPTPIDVGVARKASLRYPLFAAVCASIPMVIGAALLGSWITVIVWLACAAVVSARPLFRIVVATRQSGEST